jgi:hypothetical protein
VLVATYEDSGQDSKNRQQISEILTTGLSTVRVHMGYEVMTPQSQNEGKIQIFALLFIEVINFGNPQNVCKEWRW